MALLSKMVSLICVRGRRVTLQAILYCSGLLLHSSEGSDADSDAKMSRTRHIITIKSYEFQRMKEILSISMK